MFEAMWLERRRADPSSALERGLAAAVRGLEIDAGDPGFLLVKGRLLLVAARAAADEPAHNRAAHQALEALRSAEGLNPLFSRTCAPLIAEAGELASGAGVPQAGSNGIRARLQDLGDPGG